MNTEDYISSGIIESYLLGNASADEAAIFECVLKNNKEVRLAFEETQKTLEDFATAQSIVPPKELKQKIWDKIQLQNVEEISPKLERTSGEKIQKIEKQEIYQAKKSNWRPYAIAASILFLASLLGNLFLFNNQRSVDEKIAQLEVQKQYQKQIIEDLNQRWDIISNPNISIVNLKGVEKHKDSKATVFWNQSTKEVFLNAENLPETPEGMQYQLWAIADGKPVNAGMYSDEKDSKISLSNIENAQAFAITLEKEGGSTTPTMENMFVMGEI